MVLKFQITFKKNYTKVVFCLATSKTKNHFSIITVKPQEFLNAVEKFFFLFKYFVVN